MDIESFFHLQNNLSPVCFVNRINRSCPSYLIKSAGIYFFSICCWVFQVIVFFLSSSIRILYSVSLIPYFAYSFTLSFTAGQPELESQDCHPRMTIKIVSIIPCDNHFRRNVTLKFYADRLNRNWECTFGTVQLYDCDLSPRSTRKVRMSH